MAVQDFAIRVVSQVRADSRVARVDEAWSECMASEGYDYPRWDAAIEDERWATAEPSPEEIDTAVADVVCKLNVNLPGVYMAVRTAYQEAAIAQDPELAALLGG
jgi:hypothetical protein